MGLQASKRNKPNPKVRQRHMTTLGGYFASELMRLKRGRAISMLVGIAVAVIVYVAFAFVQMATEKPLDPVIIIAVIAGLVVYADMRRPL